MRLVGIALLAFLGVVSWVVLATSSVEKQDISNYYSLSAEHLGAVDRAESFRYLPGTSEQLQLEAFTWMACDDNWLLDGSPEFGPGGLRRFPLPAALEQQRVIQDLIELAPLETSLADPRMPQAERTAKLDRWNRLMEQERGDEANLRLAMHLPPLQDYGVAYHVMARCGQY